MDFGGAVWGQLVDGPIAVSARVGLGLFGTSDENVGSDVDWQLHVGIGAKYAITDFMAVRFDWRHVFTDGLLDDTAHVFDVTFGLDFWVWR